MAFSIRLASERSDSSTPPMDTEPLVRVMVEAPEKGQCRSLAQRVVDVIEAQGHQAE